MSDLDTINDDIVTSATGPSRVVVGIEDVTARTIDEKIKAANHIAARDANSNSRSGLRFFKFVPPGGG